MGCGISSMIGGFGTIATTGETVAIPVNLAQASQSRLGETNRDSPKPVCAKGHPGDPLKFLSEQTSRPGERGLA